MQRPLHISSSIEKIFSCTKHARSSDLIADIRKDIITDIEDMKIEKSFNKTFKINSIINDHVYQTLDNVWIFIETESRRRSGFSGETKPPLIRVVHSE